MRIIVKLREQKNPQLSNTALVRGRPRTGEKSLDIENPRDREVALLIVFAVAMLAMSGASTEAQCAVAALLAARLPRRDR
jgi:hypothetical protein